MPIMPNTPAPDSSPTQSLAADLLDRIDQLIREAEAQVKPLELEPYRSQLFEMFVLADASGLMTSDAEPELSPESLSRALAHRWGLDSAATTAAQQAQIKLSPEHLSKMRLLWSFLRLWMEWQYAWSRWAEFHDRPTTPITLTATSHDSRTAP